MRSAFLLCVPLLLVVAGCRSHQDRIQEFRVAYRATDYPSADAEVDELISEASDVELELVRSSCALAGEVDVTRGDTALFFLEKSMVQLALGNHDCALDLLRKSRECLDPRLAGKDVRGYIGSVATDDMAIDFVGADYEHILVRTLLAVIDLLLGGDDAYAYALQIDQKQEEILGSTFGVGLRDEQGQDIGYSPASRYERVAVGAYLVGVVKESQRDFDEASKAYARAFEWSGGVPVVGEALRETNGEARPPAGAGLIHVLYLGGSGPQLVQGTSPVTDLALSLAKVVSLFQTQYGVGTLGQAPVPVPVVGVVDPVVPPLEVETALGSARTELLLDVNAVAQQQLDANMPWILARAVVRRTLKATAANRATDGMRQDDQGWGNLVGILANVALTAGERADTRNWTTLPAQIQVARLWLPPGIHRLDLGRAGAVDVSVKSGASGYVVVVQPNLQRPASIQVDRFTQREVALARERAADGAEEREPEPAVPVP